MPPEYYIYVIASVLILPAILFAMYAQFKVISAFNKYSTVPSQIGITAAQLAEKLLREHGCEHVQVEQCRGHLSDHYDPRKKVVRLSSEVYGSTSLAALGIAAHEVGHAIQDKTNYVPLKLRQIVIKSTSLINRLLVPLIIIGLIASIFTTGMMVMGIPAENFFFWLIIAFCTLYAISFVINVITLPTEYDASRRAKRMLVDANILVCEDERRGVASVLGAAALTYVAALIISLVYLLRFLGLALMMSRRR